MCADNHTLNGKWGNKFISQKSITSETKKQKYEVIVVLEM